MANDMETGEVRPHGTAPRQPGQTRAAPLARAELAVLSPRELMRRALSGCLSDKTLVDRELRRRGPAAVAEAQSAVPVDRAALAGAPDSLEELTRRLRTLRAYWRIGEGVAIERALSEADALPARRETAAQAWRDAHAARDALPPSRDMGVESPWYRAQAAVTQARQALTLLRQGEDALFVSLEVELWHARLRAADVPSQCQT
ncbi:hypothetical protein D7X74_07715 [Corallococcus sp. CA047B]|uniref:hypothetical protein n=1 Tax=Corallococcus sp. CA047B TaxID=2316729 RepID=UPI000EA23119|nr:hypothetical protein [Corallococcus sp. CA047B]RKH19168.1 hypothetical protein D7X74_07715 [Corallococcus sp. CA047B]